MISDADSGRVLPLGAFGLLASQREMEGLGATLKGIAGSIAVEERAAVSRYLRSAPTIFAIMEHTWDVLHRAFDVAGGSGIQTDGVYYWRRDAAEYVEHYGSALPAAFLEAGRLSNWRVPNLSESRLLDIDDYLRNNIRRTSSR